ncbi:Ff.00g134610.m01.CDS01 [Fusarium sp. VM40]|nr:Ff.00g134610.m01.CDS01 [Fusarium sp. VM40]
MENINHKQDVLLRLSQCRKYSNDDLLQIRRDQQKKNRAAITKLESMIEFLTIIRPDPYISPNFPDGTSEAALSLDWLLRILSSPIPGPPASNGKVLDLEFLEMRDDDLHTVLSSAATIHPRSQSQVNATDSASPLSLLCARLGLALAKMEPENVFVHFYCGIHVDSGCDNWSGPGGMIRSILVQIIAALVAKDIIGTGHLYRTRLVRHLENHDPGALCNLIYYLVRLLDPGETIYCFIDGVSRFDVDSNGTFGLLRKIIEHIEVIVKDCYLKPKLKVLMTAPSETSDRLSRIIEDQFYVSASPHAAGGR